MTRPRPALLRRPWAFVLGTVEPEEKKPDSQETTPAASPQAAELARLRDQIAKMRDHLAKYGSAVGALATAVLTGVGWATFTDIAPVPEGRGWLTAAAAVAAALALGGAVWLVSLFFAAQRRIVFDTDSLPDPGTTWSGREKRSVRKSQDLTQEEARAAWRPLADLAREEFASDIAALERRQYRLARSARHYAGRAAALDADAPERAPLAARSAALQAESDRIAGAHAFAGVLAAVEVLETRQRKVFRGASSRVSSLVVVAGIVALFVIADYSAGVRALDAARLACSDKLVALAGAELAGYSCDARGRLVEPTASTPDDPEPDPGPTADVALLERLATCETTAATATSDAPRLEGWEERTAAAIAICAGLPVTSTEPGDTAGDETDGAAGTSG